MNRKSAAFELPEYAPNRGMQIWLWFVNISRPVTVWKAVSSKWQNCYQNPKLYMSHLGTSAPTSNVFSLPKYFCWAHFFSTWKMRLFASQWSPIRIHKRGRITQTLFSGCGEAQTRSTFRLFFFLSPFPSEWPGWGKGDLQFLWSLVIEARLWEMGDLTSKSFSAPCLPHSRTVPEFSGLEAL